ncbi:Ankyrin repeat domain-containing protein 40 [Tupaia chinensis]|uniref:Ankyrin repeat domain-containing protein 40 n=1 Tax=Tupaia chinensis TaxID=246437 RepID=L9KIC9_TUPCH|nr:Ankyrin repeat domain-containing protein 40 [Tupaia chinensis]
MAEPEQDIGEKLPGEHKQKGANPRLSTEPSDDANGPGGLELVLKIRIQSPKENDFIEIELNRQELSYQNLLKLSCSELGIDPEQVEKMRKLPNTLLRKNEAKNSSLFAETTKLEKGEGIQ